MKLRRCAVLLIEPRETLDFDLAGLLQGGTGLQATLSWVALAPHLDAEVTIDLDALRLLGEVGETTWIERDTLTAHDVTLVDRLLDAGLLIADDGSRAHHRERDDKLRRTYWHPLSAVAHGFGRWRDVDSADAWQASGVRTIRDMVARLGPPPYHQHERGPADTRIALPVPSSSALSALMARRVTCRNYDRTRALPLAVSADVLHRSFGALAAHEGAPDAFVVKKNAPSGGGLHATEAYVLLRDVDGLDDGLYHYHCGAHALQPLPRQDDTDDLDALARRFVAGQHWFADAHVVVALAPRFRRSYWKYRNHTKAYRALILDVGHLSQTLYLSATEAGLGAFITAAINEVEIERAFGLDPLEEGPLAVCGFGWRGAERETVEFDPLHAVWPADAASSG